MNSLNVYKDFNLLLSKCTKMRVAANFCQATDPIQQLFVDKIREYNEKSKGELLEPSEEITKMLQQELEKVDKTFERAPNEDMTKFPSFEWTEPKIDPVVEEEPKEAMPKVRDITEIKDDEKGDKGDKGAKTEKGEKGGKDEKKK